MSGSARNPDRAAQPLEHRQTDGMRVLWNPAAVDRARTWMFDPEEWRSRGAVVDTFQGRGTAYVVDPGNEREQWVLRHLRRGGLPGRFVEDRYLWTGLERSRPFRELRLLARLAAMELPVPAPVAAAVHRAGIVYTGDIITTRVPGRPLAHVLERDEPRAERWWDVGRTLRRFHDAGVFHADLSAGNILLAEEAVYLIDFDRGRIRPPGGWPRRNLARLERSASTIVGMSRWREDRWRACWQALQEGYAGSDRSRDDNGS